MSSSKDYILDVAPSDVSSSNLIKFTVRHRQESVVLRYRWSLTALIQTAMFTFLWFNDTDIHSQRVILVCGTLLFAQAVVFLRQSPEDTIIAIKNVGVSSISKKCWRFLSDDETFIPVNEIIDLVIHEGFHGYGEVIFYLCALTKSKADASTRTDPSKNDIIKIFFPNFLPRKDVLLKVWSLSKQLLFAETRSYWRRVPGKGLQKIQPH